MPAPNRLQEKFWRRLERESRVAGSVGMRAEIIASFAMPEKNEANGQSMALSLLTLSGVEQFDHRRVHSTVQRANAQHAQAGSQFAIRKRHGDASSIKFDVQISLVRVLQSPFIPSQRRKYAAHQ